MNNTMMECENCHTEMKEEFSLHIFHEYVNRDIHVCSECYGIFLDQKVKNIKRKKHQVTMSPLVQFAAELSINMENDKYRLQLGSQNHRKDVKTRLVPSLVPRELLFEPKKPS